MIEIAYNHTNFEDLLKQIGRLLKVKITDNILRLPAETGKGLLRVITLHDGLQVLVSNCSFNENVLLKREKTEAESYIFRFDEMIQPESGISSSKSAALLSNTRNDWLFLTPGGVHLHSISVIFSKDRLNKFLGTDDSAEDIKKYLLLKTGGFPYEPLDVEYKRMLNELITGMEDSRFELFIVYNRVMLLIERFFTRVIAKMNDAHFNVKVSAEDIARLKTVEAELVKDFTAEPAGINKLARLAMMSPTKLKQAFKEIYGMPVYQYYQKQRMNRARAMLTTKKYSVKQVGLELGYANMSNFAKAYSKVFHHLPGEAGGKKN
ncbi:helix-turn-helix domain-containing protein [Foetidibacter luteolus]|uniref:helix-turn-helix domain-containing protein n=1 Tax=Foetidibacter luteolus TaxID=2608880 RepID=UPI00129BAD8F|nr:helix-turn-helix domain-containing protein [Foetidibacter luteolus]